MYSDTNLLQYHVARHDSHIKSPKHETINDITGFLLGLMFDREDGGDMFLRNAGGLLPKYKANS
jgi:hypothetical protein